MAREIKARGAEEKSPLLPCTPAPRMIFSPSKWLGLSIGLTALALIGASDFFLLPVARANFPSWLTFLILCWLIASVPLVIWLGYRCYALARARYVVTRNALVVQWGFRRELIPMGLLGEVRAGTEAEGDSGLALRPREVTWPGYFAGQANIESLGEVEFLASTGRQAGLVLVSYPDGWLALSPSDPQAFISAIAERRAEGTVEEIEPESVLPALPYWALWRDRLALALIVLGGASVLLLTGYLTLIYPQLPPQFALHFNPQGQPDRFGPPTGLFLLPVIAGVAWMLNTLGGIWLHLRGDERAGAYLLFGATVFVQALVWVAAIGLLTAGRA